MMRIVIDMQAAQDECRHRGIGSCALSVAKEICRAGKEHIIFLALNALFEDTVAEIREIFLGLVPQHRICLWYPPLIDEYLAEENAAAVKETVREAFLSSLKPDAIFTFDASETINTFDKTTPVFNISAFEEINKLFAALPSDKNKKLVFKDNHEIVKLLSEAMADIVKGGFLEELTEALAICIAKNFPKKKQLLIDVTDLIDRDSTVGLRRIERNILINLLNMPNQDYTVCPAYFFYDTYYNAECWLENFLDKDMAENKNFPPLITYAGDIFFVIELFTGNDRYFSALRKLRLKGVIVKTVVYDLLPLRVPWSYDKQFVENFRVWLLNILEYDGVICISQTVADVLKSWIELNAPHRKDVFSLDVFPMGSDEDNANFSDNMPKDAESILNKISSKPSFLLVSTIEPKKGHLQAVQAFDLLWKRGEDINLVFVGKHGWLADKIVKTIKTHKLFGEKLFWLTDADRENGASEKYLNEAYKASACLIFPSAEEGFGLPVVEAARHGLPLVLRDIPIFREVAGDNAYYFSGFEAEDLASAITEWLKLCRAGQHPKPDGIRTYTWKESAEALLKILLKE
jgi:glycosyltransferase involved in cell wall biosynthesis